MFRNPYRTPMALYVVHVDDAGKPAATVRVVATLILLAEETVDSVEFQTYLNTAGCAFKAALVRETGEVVMHDPRYKE